MNIQLFFTCNRSYINYKHSLSNIIKQTSLVYPIMTQQTIPPQPTDQLNVTVGTRINGSIYNSTYILQNTITPSFFSQYKYIIILTLIVSFIILRLFRKKGTGRRNVVYIVGERGAGKTQLIYSLAKGMKVETVPSIKNNATTYKLNERKAVELVDVAGANHTKEEFISNLDRSLAIIQVVDGTDAESLLGTAQLLYKILISKSYQKNQPNHILFLNKSDSLSFLGEKMFQKKLQDEMERIKLSRRTMLEEKEGEDDTIKEQKGRWNLSDYNIKVVKGSVSTGEIAELEKVLNQ